MKHFQLKRENEKNKSVRALPVLVISLQHLMFAALPSKFGCGSSIPPCNKTHLPHGTPGTHHAFMQWGAPCWDAPN